MAACLACLLPLPLLLGACASVGTHAGTASPAPRTPQAHAAWFKLPTEA